ncbi:MAG TPA: TetR/AcrR family transcriptional regulator, partial [Clostridium sp.]|nr:TetR/AcrR family transcriptional regulator [Clostridium sp.]
MYGKKMRITAKKELKEKELCIAGYELFLEKGIE